jgi:nicotinamidase-related amidase
MDRFSIHLLLIDLQKDFCFPEGALYVGGRSGRGAIEDNHRISTFIYRNLPHISEITCTADAHLPHQIFFPSFWLDEGGKQPPAHTQVTVDSVRSGKLRPNPEIAHWIAGGSQEWLRRQVEFYCRELERAGKYTLYLWPPHCLLGSEGQAFAGVIQEARLFGAFTRGWRASVVLKGDHPLTENYSVLSPEVLLRHDGHPMAQRNTRLLKTLLESDAVIVAGQAASHCVKSTIEDLLGEIQTIDSKLARKVYILRDGMSAVAVPDPGSPGKFLADFTPQAEEALEKFAAAGMHVVESTVPVVEWPGMSS